MFKEGNSSILGKMVITWTGAGGARKKRGTAVSRKVKDLTRKTSNDAQKQIATKVVKTEVKLRKVSRVLKSEKRYKDVLISGVSCSSTGAVALVNGMNTGDTDGYRMGTDFLMSSMKVKGHFYPANSTSANARILLVYDKQANAAALTVGDVLVSADPESLTNYTNKKRFKIIFDKSYAIPGNNSFPKRFDFSLSLRNLETHCNTGNAGTIADIVTGSLYWIYLSDVSAGVNAPSLDLHSRLFYNA